MPKRTGLGKGLDALIPSGFEPEVPAPSKDSSGVLVIPVSDIVPNPRQPRSHFDAEALNELASSIKEHGIIQPLLVSHDEGNKGYVLVAGERRWQAARIAGLTEVPVIVRQTTDLQRLELALIENIQRADLNALEEADAYRQLSEAFGLSHEEIATRVGKSRAAVTNTLRLLKLAKEVQQALVDDLISEGHARALLALSKANAQNAALNTVLSKGLTVRQTEELVRRWSGEKSSAPPKEPFSPDLAALEEKLRANLGTKVSLRTGKKGNGSLTLYYYSDEELNAILARLLPE